MEHTQLVEQSGYQLNNNAEVWCWELQVEEAEAEVEDDDWGWEETEGEDNTEGEVEVTLPEGYTTSEELVYSGSGGLVVEQKQVGQLYCMSFQTWEQFVRYADNDWQPELGNASRTYRAKDNWDFNTGFEQAVIMGYTGWPEGARQIEERMKLLRIAAKRAEPELVMSRVGPGSWDMQRLQQGHPMPWIAWQESERAREGQGQLVRVLVNMAFNWDVSAQQIMERGAALCAMVYGLEEARKRVEVDLVFNLSNRVEIRVHLKSAGMPLNIDRVAFALAHPASLRRLGLSVLESVPAELREEVGIKPDRGYGWPSDVLDYTYTIVMRSGDASSVGSQRTWVESQLIAQGVELA